MKTIDLFFVVICKDDYVCSTEQGPFLTQENAQDKVTGNEKVSTRCYRCVAKVSIECELMETL